MSHLPLSTCCPAGYRHSFPSSTPHDLLWLALNILRSGCKQDFSRNIAQWLWLSSQSLVLAAMLITQHGPCCVLICCQLLTPMISAFVALEPAHAGTTVSCWQLPFPGSGYAFTDQTCAALPLLLSQRCLPSCHKRASALLVAGHRNCGRHVHQLFCQIGYGNQLSFQYHQL